MIVGVSHFGLLTSCSDEFNKRNLKTDINGSISRIKEILSHSPEDSFHRIYLSMTFHSQWEGKISNEVFEETLEKLKDLEFDELVLSDTTGHATPDMVKEKIDLARKFFSVKKLACHFIHHDTKNMAVKNIKAALMMGIGTFDSSTGGLGGCPYSPGATGNVATRDVLKAFTEQGAVIDLDEKCLNEAAEFIRNYIASH